jgi:hypothetical protein
MVMTISISPRGQLCVQPAADADTHTDEAMLVRIGQEFARGQSQGLLHLATHQLQSKLPPQFAFARDFGCI